MISVDIEKIWQDLTPIQNNNSQQTKNRNILSLIKNTYKDPTVSIILNGRKPEVFLLTWGIRQDVFSHHSFSIVLEVQGVIRQKTEIGWKQDIHGWDDTMLPRCQLFLTWSIDLMQSH